ncbi:ArnT family glycosyltransferase [Nitrospira sp. Nam74]
MAISEDKVYWGRLGIKQEVLLVTLIMLAGAVLRLFAFAEISDGTLRFVGTCGQLFDEAKPLFDARNPLHFEVFFYPPVAPIIVASTGMLLQAVLPEALDFAHYCLVFNIGVSVATLLVIYMIGRQWSVPVGLAAMSFYAVTMIAIYSSDNVQMYPTFFSMLALYFFFRSIQKQSMTNLILMGVLLGLAVSSKYFPVMLILMLFMVYFVSGASNDRESFIDDTESQAATGNGNPQVAYAWNYMLYTVLSVSIGICYITLFHNNLVWSGFQSLYDMYPHDHPFEHHFQMVNRLYHIGILCVGVVASLTVLSLYIPHRQGLMPWAWFKKFSRHQRLWLIPAASMSLTIVVALGVPAILNLNNYLRYTTWIAKTYASADGGFFPAGNPAPSYLLSYFPENLGIPLFILGCLGIIYCLYIRDLKAVLLLFIALPLYIALELSSVKVNRFAMDIMPVFCLLAAILIVQVMNVRHSIILRTLSIVTFIFVMSYSSLYSLAWANLQRSLHVIPVQTAGWISTYVPQGSRIGMKADLWLAGSPGLLPDPNSLSRFEIANYTEYPEFIILPKTLYEIMKQYADLTSLGYTYRPEDWTPFAPPIQAEATVLMDLVSEQQYELVKEFEQKPTILGVSFSPQSLGGRTWLLEHTGPYGIRVYKKRQLRDEASLYQRSDTH